MMANNISKTKRRILRAFDIFTDGKLQDVADTDLFGPEQTFSERFAAVSEERIAAIKTDERAAARSRKQRTRKKKENARSESWTARLEPSALAILSIIAEEEGGKGPNDAMHWLVNNYANQKRITQKRINEHIKIMAERRAEKQAIWAKRVAGRSGNK